MVYGIVQAGRDTFLLEGRCGMARAEVLTKSQGTGSMKLSPAPFVPAMSFEISNQTGVDIKVIIDGKRLRLELQQSS